MAAPTLLILAAGLGSRYRGNKLNDPVGPDGETIMDYSIYDAHRAGFSRILFVIRRGIDLEFRGSITARYGKHLAPEYVYQDVAKLPAGFRTPPGRVQPWGTAQAVLMAAQTIHEPFAVINGDDFYGADSYRAMARHLASGTQEYATVGFVLRNTLPEFGPAARAVCEVGVDGCLTGLTELKNIERDGGHAQQTDAEGNVRRLTGDEIVSMNMWGFTPQIFPQLEARFGAFLKRSGNDLQAEFALPEAIGELVASQTARIRVLHCADTWFGVTHGQDQSHAVLNIRQLVASGYYPRKILQPELQPLRR